MPQNRIQPKTKPLVNLMLDSGAFGAWKRGQTLDIYAYIDYVKRHKHLLYSYVNMDVIPGSFGKMTKTQKEIEDSARLSYENLQIIKDAGLSPIPVFHQGERFYWLEKMLTEGEPYIGISPYKSAKKTDLFRWLDRVFTIITSEDGLPLCKTHGFGVTDQDALIRYPWFTCDSTSWTLGPSYGSIPIPIYINGKPDYYKHHRIISISGREQKEGSSKQTYDSLGPLGQEAVRRFITEEVGATLVDARYDPHMRRRISLTFYRQLLQNIICERFTHRQPSVHFHPPKGMKPLGPWHVKLMFATSMTHGQYAELMNEVCIYDRLISYFDCKDIPIERVEGYVKTGLLPDYQRIERPRGWRNETYMIFRRFSLLNRIRKPHEKNRFKGE